MPRGPRTLLGTGGRSPPGLELAMDVLLLAAFSVTVLVGTLVLTWVAPALVIAALAASADDLA